MSERRNNGSEASSRQASPSRDSTSPAPTVPDAAIRNALYNVRSEGIADQIDKPPPWTTRPVELGRH